MTLDRALPVPLGAQLRGLVEYGIACGEFRPGDRLPSVRDLAEELGVAPMTVAQVYRDLKAAGLIEARAGSGTFVARRALSDDSHARLAAFHRQVDALVAAGLALGLRSGDIAGLVAARLSARQAGGPERRIALVGLFAEATADYARTLAAALGPGVTVLPITMEALQSDAAARARVLAFDLVLTFAHRRREIADLLPEVRVEAISFIPAEATRRALASLDPRTRVLAVSRFPAFLPMMRPGVQRFAPHVATVDAAVLDDPCLHARLGGHDVVVYATGAEAVLDRLAPGVTTIEYRHSPDPGDIDRIVRPLLEAIDPALTTRKETR
ncbi:GntR family transcriptional regulator [Lichenihabitans sp. Uapishka_5]|uniref:GntR family transcriptional regulator n=1 Tax=Lichenihabitans sp. Uapishka_5 TaxID=3037302 RepID=UPI0029E7E839|nr:GntR family transcriptional regulator [Lichenihabitans sp. Uapishka_5]MDX7950516.1 GntR family transcriptional regulator [Lichenihabitans sp. Uapishka_5]